MRECTMCKGAMRERAAKMPDGIPYHYYHCKKCGDEVLDMAQLGDVAAIYRKMKRHHVKLSKWGLSLGMRIPKEMAKQYKLTDRTEVVLIPEKQGIRIVPA